MQVCRLRLIRVQEAAGISFCATIISSGRVVRASRPPIWETFCGRAIGGHGLMLFPGTCSYLDGLNHGTLGQPQSEEGTTPSRVRTTRSGTSRRKSLYETRGTLGSKMKARGRFV